MTADGFLNQKQRHPVAMTAALAINIAAVSAVMLAKSGVIALPPGAIPTILIRELPPPDPIETPVAKAPEAKTEVYIPPRKTPVASQDVPVIKGTDVQPDYTGAGTADPNPQPTPAATATPIPNPVIVDAAPLGSAARDFQPPYPPQLLRTGIEGKAVVRVLIGTDGRVKQVAIISADDPLFADATERQALRKWRFKPATRDGVAVESWKQMTVRFEIRS